MAICAFQFSIPQLMILIVESFHVKDGTLRKMLGKVIKNIMLSHIPYPLQGVLSKNVYFSILFNSDS